jgi:hypothetical protein
MPRRGVGPAGQIIELEVRIMSALDLIYKSRMTFGIELPLDRDWSEAGQRLACIEGRPFGVPDTSTPAKGVELAERLGFDAVWLRDVPVHDPNFGDAGQVFDPFLLSSARN